MDTSNSTPPDETTILRYMDAYKFIDLVLTQELFLCRLACLNDPREGTLPASVLDKDRFIKERSRAITSGVRECVCVNCWYASEHEDRRMWEEYGARCTGLCIRSSVGRLKAAISNAAGEQFIGQITYVDFERGEYDVNGRQFTAAICVKDDSFRHENEVRLFAVTPAEGTLGHRVRVDVSELIEGVIVGCSAPSLAEDVVQRILREHDVVKPLVRSGCVY